MKRILGLAVAISAVAVVPAIAQVCTNATTAGMTPGQIKTLVVTKYACVGTFPNAQWNELHNSSTASGNVLDYKLGPTSPTDPSDTPAHPTGQFAISAPNGAQAPGLITYTYGANSYTYYVVNNLTPPRYSFCGTGAAPQLAVTISATHC
ncbi:MAG TPA: hypothetical protein DDZ81_05950 [Acetobacteraceae bacterium]|nr:hypothetical protein [Acetobacteraceae bacterium]